MGNLDLRNNREWSEAVRKLVHSRQAKNINEVETDNLTRGDRLADKLADIAGSWGFIFTFLAIMITWIMINSSQLILRPFDPYPYILLNLVLSCVAAIQAPVIMMSQNRQEKKDRLQVEHDYNIDLKAEILIEEIIIRLDKLEENQKKSEQNQREVLALISELYSATASKKKE